ncbi:MAG: rhamnogalacturonan acetylesterase [Bacteroides sp. 43_108]|nr:MAG: rhamnogalacturonan acetylesterase [Bacteroides sp. 43_108]
MKTTLSLILTFSLCGTLLAQTPKKMESMADVNKVTDLTLDSLAKANQVRPVSGSSRKGNNPVLFLVGNSTMRNGTLGNGNNGQWGWGYFERQFFDENKITVENHALGGTSSRTFWKYLWKDVLKGIRPGDYVVLELGHNDNGPFDSGRARASIKGISHEDSLVVTIKETGVVDTVYSFGEYMRKYIADIRKAGATPILMSLTPRNAYEAENPNRIARVDKTFGLWSKQIAEEQNVPFIDLNDISAKKFESFGKWKTDYHFFGDKIHSSEFGAILNARSAAEGIASNNDPQLDRLRACLLPLEPKTVKVDRKNGRPVVFLTGDSTVKNEDKKKDGMWGWGSQAYTVFDSTKCTVVNCAKAGRSTRTYLNEGRWDEVYNSIRPGDYVLIQFGHNDIGDIDKNKERGTIATADDTCHVYKLASNGQYKVIYSFGWYLKKFIGDVKEKGGIPVLVSLTPRNEWPGGKVERRNDSYGKWYRDVVEATGVDFIDLHNITADALDKMGRKKAAKMFCHDHTHSSLKGAQLNAKGIAEGIRRMNSPMEGLLK